DGLAANASLDSRLANSLLSLGVGSTNQPQPWALRSMTIWVPVVSPSIPLGRLPARTVTWSRTASRGSSAPSAVVHSCLAAPTVGSGLSGGLCPPRGGVGPGGFGAWLAGQAVVGRVGLVLQVAGLRITRAAILRLPRRILLQHHAQLAERLAVARRVGA